MAYLNTGGAVLGLGDDDMANYDPSLEPSSNDSGINWGGLITGVFKSAADLGTAYARQELLNTTYVKNPNGTLALDAQGNPILANSAAGAAAAQKAASTGWIMPLAIGAAVLALVTLLKKR